MKIFSAEQLYKADAITVENQKISSSELMERAGVEVFNWLHKKMKGSKVPIHIFCGIGNNGGDGLVVGRLLIEKGYNINTYIVNYTNKRSKDFLINYDRIKHASKKWPVLMTSEKDFPKIKPEDIIVDAIFGIGLNRPPEGWVKNLIQHLNKYKAFKLAIDIPSGLYSNKALNDTEAVILASHTLTFQSPKLAFFLPETARYAPYFEVLNIGLDPEYLVNTKSIAQTFDKLDAQKVYKPREKFDHKGSFGHALIIGGSFGKLGAALLAAKATLKIGAGLVSVFVPSCGYQVIQAALPEAMTIVDAAERHISSIKINFIPSAIGVGMGIGTTKETVKALKNLFSETKSPLVVDADALNCISENKELLNILPKNSILTPHPGELKRLIGTWKNDYDKIDKALKFSKKYEVILLIKGAYTLTIYEDEIYINTTGNPGMATAGSGDVLSGIITGLLSQGYEPSQAAKLGVYLHGSAGNIASHTMGFEAVIASEITDNIGSAYLALTEQDGDMELTNDVKKAP